MLELAYLLVSGDGHADRVASSLIVPNGIGISRKAQAVHGITPQLAAESGVEVEEALADLFSAARETTVIVAHNALFDRGVIAAEADRAGLPAEAIAGPW